MTLSFSAEALDILRQAASASIRPSEGQGPRPLIIRVDTFAELIGVTLPLAYTLLKQKHVRTLPKGRKRVLVSSVEQFLGAFVSAEAIEQAEQRAVIARAKQKVHRDNYFARQAASIVPTPVNPSDKSSG